MVDHAQIKARRKDLELTLDEAAHRAGLPSRHRWWEIESGTIKDPRATTLAAIACVLNCTMDELMRPQ